MANYANLTRFTATSNLWNFNITDLCYTPKLIYVSVTFQNSTTSSAPVPLPPCLSNLQALATLILNPSGSYTGGLTGAIDGVNWNAMSSLQTLELGGAGLNGNLPLKLPSSLTSLTINLMTVTSSLSSVNWTTTSLTSLQMVSVNNLQFGDTPSNVIPANVTTLTIISNVMTPYVISMSMFQLASFPRLQSLKLQGILTGSLSSDLYTLTSLSLIDLSYNNLGGALDIINWARLTNLAYVIMQRNNFTSFGSAFSNTPRLQQLWISANPNLAGSFPEYLLQSSTFNRL